MSAANSRRVTWGPHLAAAGIGVWLIGATATAASQAPQPNTLTAAERAAGWTLLFDGTTIDQWRGFRQQGVPAGWQVVDGAITRVGGGADLISREQYDAFEFRFDWLVSPGGNSGVMYHVTEAHPETYATGPEYQILDNGRHPDGKDPLTSAGSCYALYAPPKDVTRPVGQWNEGRIVVTRERQVEHWLNGERTARYQIGSDEWKRLVASSKWKDYPAFATATRGHLAIQEHGNRVAFRNLRIRTTK